jgi:tight adherence protein C
MYTWILIGGAVLAIGVALKNLFSSRVSRSDRPRPQLTGLQQTPNVQNVHRGLQQLASQGKDNPVTQQTIDGITGERSGAGFGHFASATVAAVPYSESHSHSTSAFQTSAASAGNRLSTWQDRRLFSDFHGILGNNNETLKRPDPEDLPIKNDELIFGTLTPSIAQLLPETAGRRNLQRKSLLGAGYHSRASWLNLTAIRFTLAFLALIVVGFWLNVAPPEFEVPLLALVIIAPLTMWALPPLVVSMKAGERKIDIERGLPDVLDMLNMGVSQGLTVPQSLKRISNEIAPAHPALAEELQIVNRQAEVGSLLQALRSFNERIDSTDVHSFTSLLMQSEATGTSISEALIQYSDSIRGSLRERADSRANAASFKLLFPVALCLMPSVFLFLLGPAIVEMSDFFGNRAQALNRDRDNALESLQQQPRIDFTRFQQNN